MTNERVLTFNSILRRAEARRGRTARKGECNKAMGKNWQRCKVTVAGGHEKKHDRRAIKKTVRVQAYKRSALGGYRRS